MNFTRVFRNIFLQSQILFFIYLMFPLVVKAQRAQRGRPRLCSIPTIPNATFRVRHNYKIMRITCSMGFTLQGSNIVACENGKWNSPMPVCTKPGCSKLEDPPHGIVMSGVHITNLFCKEHYKLAGGRITYCNGTHWDRPLGECRESIDSIQLSCDFETNDLCGWTHDETHNFDWKRIMAANTFQQLRTGPQHDHTTLTANSGHYMLMESFDQLPHSVARLISPIYSKNLTKSSACFRFFYFMYGATVGSLNVYIKPISVDLDQLFQESRYQYFTLSGNQKNSWKEGLITVGELQEDFQVIIEGTAGNNHLSDIAIDDVHLLTHSECNNKETTSMIPLTDYTEIAIYDIQSCEGRCQEKNSTGFGIKNENGRIFKTCDCHSDCENLQTCCPNFRSVCEFETFMTTPELIDTTYIETTHQATAPTMQTTYSTKAKPVETTTLEAAPHLILPAATESAPAPITLSTTKEAEATKSYVTETTTSDTTSSTQLLESTTFSQNYFADIIETNLLPKATPGPVTQNSSTEDIILKRREKVMTWKTEHDSRKYNTEPGWLIFTTIFAVLIIAGLVGIKAKHHFKIVRSKVVRSCRYSSEDYGETAALTYSPGNDTNLENSKD